MINISKYVSSMALVSSVFVIASCKEDPKANQKPLGAYKVVVLEPLNTTLFSEYPTRLQGIQDIDIRPKIDGYIEGVHIDEGQEVRAGQVLFTINNPQFAQDVNNTQALIASAEAAVATARLQVEKTKPLVTEGIISAYELETAQLNLSAKEAALAQARATYNNAKINKGYTSVTSPVNGIVGSLPYRLGSYVNSATAQPLTTISDITKIYAYFSVNEKQQLDFAQDANGGTFSEKIKNLPSVELVLSNGEVYAEKGKVESFSGLVNSQTGSFNVRAGFPNMQKLLRSGSSATIRIPQYLNNAIVIPQYATTELQNKRMAYVLSDSNTVKAIPVTVRPVPGGQYFVVDSGLKKGDKLVVEGIGIVTNGTAIQPVVIPWDSIPLLQKK